MSHGCPRCGGALERKSSAGAGFAFGLVGALVAMAFSGLHCAKCGKIPSSELPPEVRSAHALRSVFMVLGAVALLVAVIWLVVAFGN